MPKLTVIAPDQLDSPVGPTPSDGHRQFLAEGDSWFSISTFAPRITPNLLEGLVFSTMNTALNCASPGETTQLMINWRENPDFLAWLCGNKATRWSGILLSAGGHDLLEALKVPAVVKGQPVPLDQRLVRSAAEWGPASDAAARYLSASGWQRFETYLRANFAELVRLRDLNANLNTPMFMHGYGNAPLQFDRFDIPPDDWPALSALVYSQLGTLLASIAAAHPHLHFFDSAQVPLAASDWRDQTHLSDQGYRKVGQRWAPIIEAVVG